VAAKWGRPAAAGAAGEERRAGAPAPPERSPRRPAAAKKDKKREQPTSARPRPPHGAAPRQPTATGLDYVGVRAAAASMAGAPRNWVEDARMGNSVTAAGRAGRAPPLATAARDRRPGARGGEEA